MNGRYLGEYVDIDEVEKVALGALNLFLQTVHPLVLHIQHILSCTDVRRANNKKLCPIWQFPQTQQWSKCEMENLPSAIMS